jgi:prolyl oligopeptidase
VEVREFDLQSMEFVEGGFTVPVSKNTTAWVDDNTILVSHNLDGEYVTTSGYSRAAHRWERGTALRDAPIIAEAGQTDMGIWVATQETTQGPLTLVLRLVTIFDTEYSLLEDGELVTLDVPSDAQMAMVGDQLVLQLVSDWTVGGRTFEEGSVVSANFEDYLASGRDVQLVVAPGERSTINGISATEDYLVVNQLTEVQGQLHRYRREGGRWVSDAIETPAMGAVGVRAASVHHNRFFFTFDSFTKPTTL